MKNKIFRPGQFPNVKGVEVVSMTKNILMSGQPNRKKRKTRKPLNETRTTGKCVINRNRRPLETDGAVVQEIYRKFCTN